MMKRPCPWITLSESVVNRNLAHPIEVLNCLKFKNRVQSVAANL